MMKITYERWETKLFEDLNTGDVFMFNGKVFMKTDQPDTSQGRVRAIILSTGEMYCFGKNVRVHPVTAEMIIKEGEHER